MRNKRQSMRPQIYVAAPLFSEAERRFNLSIRDALLGCMKAYLPQEQVGLVSEMVKGGDAWDEAVCRVFRQDIAAIEESDALLIVLDGRSVDEGAAFELGFAYAIGKPCVGLQTDSRRAHPWGNNPMIHQSARPVFHSVAELAEWARCLSTQPTADERLSVGVPRAASEERDARGVRATSAPIVRLEPVP